jgi:hypothetical protein
MLRHQLASSYVIGAQVPPYIQPPNPLARLQAIPHKLVLQRTTEPASTLTSFLNMVSAKKVSQVQATSEDEDIESPKPEASTLHRRERSLVKWTLPKLDVEGIQSKLNSHEHFEIKSGYTMSGLPKFHDLIA